MTALRYKIADSRAELEAIHELNYVTFVEEIPQHPPNAARRLVDRFDGENVYAICMDGDFLVGMLAGRCRRPFSLDAKLGDLDGFLPRHNKAVEIRLLAVRRSYRRSPVFARLVTQLARHFSDIGCDLAVISGTVRQLRLYRHMGFRQFGPLVGTPEAGFQPMYLTLEALEANRVLAAGISAGSVVEFLPGPVLVTAGVRKAFEERSISHRSAAFMERMARVRRNLCSLTNASHVLVMPGTGTLANDAIAAQIRHRGGKGLVLTNGEFGERLAAHARGWNIAHDVFRSPWGEVFDWRRLRDQLLRERPSWVWAVLSETSTGMANSPTLLRELCAGAGAVLCLDAISAVGLTPVDLAGIWLASAVSGKGLAAFPGLALIFHDGDVSPVGSVPRYVDLAAAEMADGVPFTHSSNLVAALDCALARTAWIDRFQRIAGVDRELRDGLRTAGLPPLVRDEFAMPGILTIPLPRSVDAGRLALALRADGIGLAYQSAYLRDRNWLQACLMGEFDQEVVARIPHRLAARLKGPS